MNKLKFLRTESGQTIRELAEILELNNYSLVSRFELGKAQYIKDDLLKRICDFFMVEANYFLGLSNDGILCKNSLGQIITITEEEYIKLADKFEVFFNKENGRHITKNGEQTLSEMRSKDFDNNMVFVMQGLTNNFKAKEIIPLLSQLNDTQLEIILSTIKAFIGK